MTIRQQGSEWTLIMVHLDLGTQLSLDPAEDAKLAERRESAFQSPWQPACPLYHSRIAGGRIQLCLRFRSAEAATTGIAHGYRPGVAAAVGNGSQCRVLADAETLLYQFPPVALAVMPRRRPYVQWFYARCEVAVQRVRPCRVGYFSGD